MNDDDAAQRIASVLEHRIDARFGERDVGVHRKNNIDSTARQTPLRPVSLRSA
jgi:hypothetical protein